MFWFHEAKLHIEMHSCVNCSCFGKVQGFSFSQHNFNSSTPIFNRNINYFTQYVEILILIYVSTMTNAIKKISAQIRKGNQKSVQIQLDELPHWNHSLLELHKCQWTHRHKLPSFSFFCVCFMILLPCYSLCKSIGLFYNLNS